VGPEVEDSGDAVAYSGGKGVARCEAVVDADYDAGGSGHDGGDEAGIIGSLWVL